MSLFNQSGFIRIINSKAAFYLTNRTAPDNSNGMFALYLKSSQSTELYQMCFFIGQLFFGGFELPYVPHMSHPNEQSPQILTSWQFSSTVWARMLKRHNMHLITIQNFVYNFSSLTITVRELSK